MTKEMDRINAEFWDELCGTTLARALGITSHSSASLHKFDSAYLDFYPYLLEHVRPTRMAKRRVLEIGLGYGTLGQKIAGAGACYLGLDIAPSPVKMMQHRLQMQAIGGSVIQGSCLALPFASATFDFVVSIGCFHHTGDIRRCVDETYRLLRPGGIAVIMVYNQFSYRQWLRWPLKTFLAWLRDRGLFKGEIAVSAGQRQAYDADTRGSAAPETVFSSLKQLAEIFKRFSQVRFMKENCDDLIPGGHWLSLRKRLLPSLGRSLGLDIYIEAQK